MAIYDDYLSELSDSNRFIVESLMVVAEQNARVRLEKGATLDKAVTAISEEFNLNDFEEGYLIERLQKVEPEPKDIDTDVSKPPVDDSPPRNRAIYFEDEKDLDEAVEILMDKGIAWSEKKSEGRPFIQFSEDEKLAEAHSTLRRKWDFVENKRRIVADVQFDNVQDYNRVLEFMRRQGMLVEFNQSFDLDEDYDQLQEKANGGQVKDTVPTKFEPVTTFAARSTRKRTTHRVDPIHENKYRVANVRKRWKLK
jgi:hypothetical protein